MNGTNRFTSTDFGYDKNGNLIRDLDPATSQVRLFNFNADNKQSEVFVNGVSVGQYFYDGEGKRVKKVVGNETTVFVYASGKLVAEYSTTGPPAEGHVNYTTTDHLGSPRIITNELGQVQSRRDFMPFGEDLNAGIGNRTADPGKYSVPGDKVRQKFTGYQKDEETKLDFAEARMYENRFGRFTAVDPLLASGRSANPQTFNRYLYVTNNPIALSDPTGLDPWWRRKSLNDSNRSDYQESKTRPDGEGWELVDFKGTYYMTVEDWNKTGKTAYLYKQGGQDFGLQKSLLDFFNPYSQNDPKQIAVRNEQVRNGAADVMGIGGAVWNGGAGTFNLGAYGVNYFGGGERVGYLPMFTPQTDGQKLFYYGTEAGTFATASISAYRTVSSGISYIRSGGMSFSAYKASRGGTETLDFIRTVDSTGAPVRQRISTEFSHMFISQATQRAHNLPNWLVNNRINVWKLNTIQHSLIDGQRFQFLRRGLKSEVGWTGKYNWFTKFPQ